MSKVEVEKLEFHEVEFPKLEFRENWDICLKSIFKKIDFKIDFSKLDFFFTTYSQ